MALSKSQRKAARDVRHADVDACLCQTVRIVMSKSGTSFRYVKSNMRQVKAACRHWYHLDNATGAVLTDQPLAPYIGSKVRAPGANGIKRETSRESCPPSFRTAGLARPSDLW